MLDGRLTVATAERSVQEIRGGRVDAGLLTLPVEESDLVTVPVLREELLLVTTPTHPLARRPFVRPDDFRTETLLLTHVSGVPDIADFIRLLAAHPPTRHAVTPVPPMRRQRHA